MFRGESGGLRGRVGSRDIEGIGGEGSSPLEYGVVVGEIRDCL